MELIKEVIILVKYKKLIKTKLTEIQLRKTRQKQP